MRLFVTHGYRATRIESIAAEAGVAVQTVYFVFGNKRAILAEGLDVAIAGDDAPVPVLERPWVQAAHAETDPKQAIRLIASRSCQIIRREAPIHAVARGAADSDSEIATLLEQYQALRLMTLSELLRPLVEKGALASGLELARATDVAFAMTSHELHQILVVDRGWTETAWEAWVTDALVAQLLP